MDDLLTPTETARMIHMSRPTIYRLMKDGKFPRPIRVGKQRVFWRRSEVVDYLASRPRAGSAEPSAA